MEQPAEERRSNRSDMRLTARYRALLTLVTLPLFIVIAALALNQYGDLRTQILHTLAQNTVSHSIAIEGIAKLASDHVLQMRAWSENYLMSPPSYPSDLRTYYKPRFENDRLDGYALDDVPDEQRQYIGQLVWLGRDPRRPEVGEVALDQALEFFALARLTHEVTPYFQWSYFFSAGKGFVAFYPWIGVDRLLELGSYPSLEAMQQDWFEYEIYTAGTPQKNPEREAYWTSPYIDVAGAGAMVSHGAPVYADGEFIGIVGTDLVLSTMERFLTELPIDVGRLMLLDAHNMLLADTAGSPLDTIRKASETAGALTQQNLSSALQTPGKAIQLDSQVLVALDTEHAPWTLVYLVSDEAIMGLLLPRLLPYAVILIVLLATLFIALYLLRREFIGPALSLVHYIQLASRDSVAVEPRLPRLWQTWAEIVSRTFSETRAATRRVRESEERLQQIINNSSQVIYVRDLDERFLLINRRYEQLLGMPRAQVIGKHVDQVLKPGTTTESRANDKRVIAQNAAMEFEESVTLKGGVHTYLSNKFPLFDTSGEIYAVCGICRDITQRKQSEEILRQAALGISEARGEDVFNALVTHLSRATGAEYAFIGVLEADEMIRTQALYAKGRIVDNITYGLEGSPCQNVVRQQFRFYPNQIQQRFPEDKLLQELGLESYAAIPLFDSAGEALGLLAVLHSEPLVDQALAESILQIFAGRAASELERERADTALRASEASYRAIFEASEDAIFVHDLNTGAIIDVNQKACEVYGYSHQEMLQLDVGTLSSGEPPYTQEDALRLIARAMQGERLNFEWHRRNRDGSLHWDEVFARRVPIGGRDRILVHTREITARKQAEEMLRASEEQYRSIINATSDALILWNQQGEIVDLNPATWRIAGYTREEFLAMPIEQHIHAASRHAFGEFMQAVKQGKSIQMEAKGFRKDGSIIYIETRTVPMQYRGKPHVLSMSRDITEQKRVAKELARQREALRQSEKLSAMGELLAGVAHELNNPLAILMGRTALLESKAKDPAIQNEVRKIHSAADRCGRIVHTFLSMARQKPAERKPAMLNDVVASAIELLGYSLRTSGIELEPRLALELPEQQMDVDQIGQVIINLLVNAQHVLAEHPEPRHIVVETGETAKGVYCRISDNGPGVPEELRQRIFDPFFTTKNGSVGTGIGLSVSRNIAREHGGELSLLETGPGATFELWIPLNTLLVSGGTGEQNPDRQEIQGSHVLVVEDEAEVADLLLEILRSAGLQATWANCGVEAMQWLETHRCDLILSDIRMPKMDGPGLWRALKHRHPELLQHTAFISGDTLSAGIAPFLKETGAPLLEKPFTPEQVLALVVQMEP